MKSQYLSIERLPGLMSAEQKLLLSQGIQDTQSLLRYGQTQQLKQDLARKLKLNQKYIQKWVTLADLARLPSVGDRYCGLLLHAGIVSVTQLAQTSFPQLHRQIVRLQVATLQTKDQSLSLGQVKRWVEEAKMLNDEIGY